MAQLVQLTAWAALAAEVPIGQKEHTAEPVCEYQPAEQRAHTLVWVVVGAEQVEAEHVRAPQQAYWPELQLVHAPLRSAG